MGKKYFIDGDNLLVVEGEIIRRLVALIPEIFNEIVAPSIVETPVKIKDGKRTKISAMLELVAKGLKAREVVEQLSGEFPNIQAQHVYNAIKYNRRKSKLREIREGLDIDDEIPDEEEPKETHNEGWLVGEIRRLWVDEERSSVFVCQDLKISLGQFNKLIIKYKISRNQSE